MMAQVPLDQAGDLVTAAIDRAGYQGYTSLAVSVVDHSITLTWKGAVPRGLQSTLAQVRARGVVVHVRPATYSLADLNRQIDDLIADERARSVPMQYRATLLEPLPNGSGVAVTVPKLNSKVQASTSRYSVVATQQAATTQLQLPTRQNDIAPFWGGARIGVAGAGCTTGFGVKDGDYYYLLTAGHCGALFSRVTNGAVPRSVRSSRSNPWMTWRSSRCRVQVAMSMTVRGTIPLVTPNRLWGSRRTTWATTSAPPGPTAGSGAASM